MADISAEEMRAHRRSYMTFERLILFSVLHIALVLACLALAIIVGLIIRGRAPDLRKVVEDQ